MYISVISLIVYVCFKLKYVISYFIKRFSRDFLFYDSFSVPCKQDIRSEYMYHGEIFLLLTFG